MLGFHLPQKTEMLRRLLGVTAAVMAKDMKEDFADVLLDPSVKMDIDRKDHVINEARKRFLAALQVLRVTDRTGKMAPSVEPHTNAIALNLVRTTMEWFLNLTRAE